MDGVMKIDYMKLAQKLGGELNSLQPLRAAEAGQPSPGKYLIMDFGQGEVRINPDLAGAIQQAIENG